MKKNVDNRVKKLEKLLPDLKSQNAEVQARLLKDINHGLRVAYANGDEITDSMTAEDLAQLDELIAEVYREHEAEWTSLLAEDPDELRAAYIQQACEDARERFERRRQAQLGKAS